MRCSKQWQVGSHQCQVAFLIYPHAFSLKLQLNKISGYERKVCPDTLQNLLDEVPVAV